MTLWKGLDPSNSSLCPFHLWASSKVSKPPHITQPTSEAPRPCSQRVALKSETRAALR